MTIHFLRSIILPINLAVLITGGADLRAMASNKIISTNTTLSADVSGTVVFNASNITLNVLTRRATS
jgi:hypothetical protein